MTESSSSSSSAPAWMASSPFSFGKWELVKPASSPSSSSSASSLEVKLGPFDMLAKHMTIAVYFAFQNVGVGGQVSTVMSEPALKQSLSHTLTAVPLLAGRLHYPNDHRGKLPAVSCNNGGVSWLSVSCTEPMSSIIPNFYDINGLPRPLTSRELNFHFEPRDSGAEPLLFVQYNRFISCGSVLLSIQFAHELVDADSVFQFVRLWSSVHRNLLTSSSSSSSPFANVSPLPYFDRTKLWNDGVTPVQPIEHKIVPLPTVTATATASAPVVSSVSSTTTASSTSSSAPATSTGAVAPSSAAAAPASSFVMPTCVTRAFLFDTAACARLKHDVCALPVSSSSSSSSTSSSFLSTKDCISALVWCEVMLARGFEMKQEIIDAVAATATASRIIIATNGRTRFQEPQLAPGYFGNCAMYSSAQFQLSPLSSPSYVSSLSTVCTVARSIRSSISRHVSSRFRASLAWLASVEDHRTIQPNAKFFCGTDLGCTAWSNHGAYDCDFGSGRPTFVSPCINQVVPDGLLVIMDQPPSPSNSSNSSTAAAVAASAPSPSPSPSSSSTEQGYVVYVCLLETHMETLSRDALLLSYAKLVS